MQLLKPFLSETRDEKKLKPDTERSFEDLVYDVKQKRKLTWKLLRLNKKYRIGLISYVLLTFILAGFFVLKPLVSISPEEETFNQHYGNFKNRYISLYGLGVSNTEDFRKALTLVKDYNILVESNMLVALSTIEDDDFSKAIFILAELDSPESEWLLALCYLKTAQKERAKKVLLKITGEKSLFAMDAEDILIKHYNND